MAKQASATIPVERVQLGIRMEKNLVKVLKGLAEYKNVSLGQFFESIVLHSFSPVPGSEGAKCASPLSVEDLEVLATLKKIYGVEWDSHSYMSFHENSEQSE